MELAVLIMLACIGCVVSDLKTPLLPIKLSADGLYLPRMGLGTAGLRTKTSDIVQQAIAIGYKLIDTAQAKEWYDEVGVGVAIRRAVSDQGLDVNEIVVVTKVHPRSYSASSLSQAIVESKRAIYGDENRTLDVVLLHSPHCWRGSCTAEEEAHDWKEAWHALQSLKKTGSISAIGVSNFDANLLREVLEISDVKVAVIQNWMDPFNQDREVRDLATQHGIAYMAYSSFGTQWDWKLKRNPVFTSPELGKIARKHKMSIAQVVTSWVLQENCVAIPRSSKLRHIQSNYVEVPFLDDEDLSTIRALDGSLGPLWD